MLALVLVWKFVAAIYPVREESMWPALEGDDDRDCVLVEKLSVRFGCPGRFAICVFRHRDGQLLVKRLLGLPGEQIDFRGGDLFIGVSGEKEDRVPRPPGLIEQQMIPVPPPAGTGLELEAADAQDGRVGRIGAAGFLLTPESGRTLTAKVVGGAGADRYCIKDDHAVTARAGEGRRIVRGRDAVPDVRITIGALEPGAGRLSVVHRIGRADDDRGDVRKVVLLPDGLEIVTTIGGKELARDRFPGVPWEHGLRVETLDGVFRVLLPSGSEWRELSATPRDTEHLVGFSGVDFEVSGAAVRLSSLEVARDVHYAWGTERSAGGLPIPPDSMFLVGDNPEVSMDSRNEGMGAVPLNALVGVVRGVVLPIRRMRIPK